jgi:hypothetical protein
MSHDEQNRSEAQHGNKDQFMNLCPILGLILWKIFAPHVPIFLPKHVETNVYEIKPIC